MEFFRNPNINFLKYKWYFLGMSLVLSVAGILSMVFWHGVPLGVEFRGGTNVYVKFTHKPDYNAIRHEADKASLHNARITQFGQTTDNEVMIALDMQETSEQALDRGKDKIIAALEPANAPAGKKDLNNASVQDITDLLMSKDPQRLGSDAAVRYSALAQQIADYRDKSRGGVLESVDQLK